MTEKTTQWFVRGDGVLFAALPDSATFQLMSKNGEFTPIDEPNENALNTSTQQSDLEHGNAKTTAVSAGSGKRGGAGRRNKADNA